MKYVLFETLIAIKGRYMEFTLAFPLEPDWWNWYLAGIVLVVLEILVPGVWIIWFGIGALLTGIATHACGGLAWPVQFVLFIIFSCGSVFLGRYLLARSSPREQPQLNQRLLLYMDRVTALTQPIVDGRGKVQFDDTLWSVKGPDLPMGTKVRVIGAEGVYLLVRPESDDKL